uniref:Serpentine receptor class gamma n=1 Tax=Haemonchus contortus TaxID=6289 RepID=A0A7I4Y2E3_HAECO
MLAFLLYIRLAYCIPSIVLYVVVMCLISKDRQRLFGSFYSLLIIQAVTNMFVFITNFYVIQLASETNAQTWWKGIYTKVPQFLIRICSCMALHFSFVQAYITFLISLNRMTVIVWPVKGERLWSIGVPLGTVLCYISPFIATFPYLTNNASWNYSSITDSYIVINDVDVAAIWFQLYVFLAVMILASSSVSVISLASLWIRRKGSRHNRLERNMFMLALGDFLIEIVLFILMTVVYKDQIIVDHDETISLIVLPFALDLKSLSTPYLIVVLNESVRTRLLRRLKLRKQVVPSRNSVLRRRMGTSSPTPDRIFRASTEATARSTNSAPRSLCVSSIRIHEK